ncbi:alpha/beta hydrolase [Microlunatus endophyticus]|uniref:Alpha/beta hydrolase n=1 Tax=Microlunatus endophyticus TaxID=1716077 RepID=A0A917W2J8_9ACTN|nr:alpha/beta fold hydrolase [Microlunatus endophyticus]GGL55323.1 alpha/beta hydrolase [Microlunatus endophyticus]
MEHPSTPGLHSSILDARPGPDRPGIVFCHGLFGQGKNWTTIGRQFAQDYRVALVDMPDHGRSPWTDELSYPAMAALLAADLESSGRRWTVVGHSMGGKIAMVLALTRPELVEQLVVVDIAPVDYGGRGEFLQYADAMRAIDLAALESRQSADDQLRAAVPDSTVRGFLLQNLRRGDRSGGPGWHWQMNLELLGDHLGVLSGFPDLDAAPYPGPTLWVAGADSDYIRQEHAGRMRQLFPRVRTVTIKNAGHWVHSEQPEIFVDVLRRFLAGAPVTPR